MAKLWYPHRFLPVLLYVLLLLCRTLADRHIAILQIICMEYIARAAANIKAIVVFAKENKDTKVRNARLQERKAGLAAGEINQDLAGLVESRRPFTWENLCYTVPVPGGQRQLLKDVFGYVKPGTLTALMGASGA